MEGVLEDKAYEDILRSPGIPLQNYRSNPISNSLFADATSYPEFFNENLVSDNRIIKQFLNNSHSNIRVFYFQLFRLGFEIETENNQGRNLAISFRRLVFYPEFEILFTNESDNLRDVYNNQQFKRFFAEFFRLLSETPKVSVEQMINTYPIIDQVMIHILRSILLNQGINEEFTSYIPTETVFGEFSSIIGLSITSYGNCWKFEDSDMFCYEQNERAIYLAYIVDQAPITQASNVAQMIPINYYDTDHTLVTQPLQQTSQQYNSQTSEHNQYNQYNQNYKYDDQLPVANNIQFNYQVQQQVVQSVPVESVHIEPNYDYKYTDKYTDPISSTNYLGSTTSPNNYTYTPSPYMATDSYTTNNYSIPNNTNNYSSPYLSNTESNSSNNMNYGSYTSYTPTGITPASTYQNVQTKPKEYSAPHSSLSSYATTLLGNERKSMTLLEQNAYGSNSNASNKLSNPAKQSMISEYFEFEAFTGETTIEKMRVPRSQAGKQSGIIGAPVVHYNQEEQFNSMKFGNFGGLATTKPQEQGPSIITNNNPANKPYEYNNYSSNQYTSPPTSHNLTAESIYNNFSSIDAYLEDLRKFTASTNALSSTQNKYKTDTIYLTYSPTAYTSYNYGASNNATANANPQTVGEYKSYNSYSSPYTPTQPTQITYTDYTSKYSAGYGAGQNSAATSSNEFGSSLSVGQYNSYSQNQNQNKSIYNYSSSSYTSPQDYSFYSSNPYVSGVSGNVQSTYQPSTTTPVNPQTTQVETKNPYLKDSMSTDYLSRYGVSSPPREISNQTKTTFEQGGVIKPQTKSGVFQRVSASEYRPVYGYQNVPQQTQQKPSSSYDRYNYQSFMNTSSSAQTKSPIYSSYSPSPAPSSLLNNYRTELSNSGIQDIINKVKPAQKPQTAAVYSQSPTKPLASQREQPQYAYSGSTVGGGYNTASSYVFNYRT